MELEQRIKKFIGKVFEYYRWRTCKELHIDIQLADHCNLNCVGCSHFSSIAEECFLKVDDYRMNCSQFAKLAKKYVKRIHLMGGEPLLHNKIAEIIEITRSNFNKSEITIVTNGILLDKMNKEIWYACKQNNVKISLTLYPININIKKICELALQYDVAIGYFNDGGYKMKFRKDVLDEKGVQNIKNSYRKCKPMCPQLYGDKFYMCQKPANIKYINKYFSKEFIVSSDDYIDIYKINDVKKLIKYLRKPIPFCRYCNRDATDKDVTWCISKRVFSEWF